MIGRKLVWETLKSGRDGRCRVAMAAGSGYSIEARSKDHLPTSVGFRGVADDPMEVAIPLSDPIRGRVVDPEGRPQPGIQVGRLIAPNYNADAPGDQLPLVLYEMQGSDEPAKLDAEGRFDLRPAIHLDSRSLDASGSFRTWLQPLCFADEALRRVAFLGFDPSDVKPAYEVVVKPARRVLIPLEHEVASPSGKIEVWWEISALLGAGGPRESIFVMSGVVDPQPAEGERLEAYWPEGRYRLTVHSADPVAEKGLEETTIEIVVPPGDGPLTLPTLRLTSLPQRKLMGQPAPEIEARDLDTGEPVKLADFRGKVVVLDFWGYWCGPCIGSMPRLMEVHDRFKDRQVVVLAVHDQSVRTRDEYDRKLAGVKHNVWGDRELPFRVALDGPDPAVGEGDSTIGRGVSCDRYKVVYFPTTYVIGADGKVLGPADAREPGRLEAMLEEQLGKTSPR
nr:TlpA disulfide reductase family protein [Paludisphaera mucosa]